MTSILPENMTAENKSANAVQQFFKEHKIGKSLRKSNFTKQKGFFYNDLIQFIVMLAFTDKNFFRFLQSDASTIPFAKDSIYQFLDDCHYNWRRFLLLLSSQIIRTHIAPLTSEKRLNFFIVCYCET